jgi:hypothetical protein
MSYRSVVIAIVFSAVVASCSMRRQNDGDSNLKSNFVSNYTSSESYSDFCGTESSITVSGGFGGSGSSNRFDNSGRFGGSSTRISSSSTRSSRSSFGGSATFGSSSSAAPTKTNAELVKEIIAKHNCIECHSPQSPNPGPLADANSFDELRTLIESKDPAQTSLFVALKDRRMPKNCDTGEFGGCLTRGELTTISDWIREGAPNIVKVEQVRQEEPVTRSNSEGPSTKLVPLAHVQKCADQDFSKVSSEDRPFIKYLSHVEAHNLNGSNSRDALNQKVLTDALYLTSRTSNKIELKEVDHFGLLVRLDIRQLGWSEDIWNKLTEWNRGGGFSRKGSPQAVVARAEWVTDELLRGDGYFDALGIKDELDIAEEKLTSKTIYQHINEKTVTRAMMEKSVDGGSPIVVDLLTTKFRTPTPAWFRYNLKQGVGRLPSYYARPLGRCMQSTFLSIPFADNVARCGASAPNAFTFEYEVAQMMTIMPNGAIAFMEYGSDGRLVKSGSVSHSGSAPASIKGKIAQCLGCHSTGAISPGQDADFVDYFKGNQSSFTDFHSALSSALKPRSEIEASVAKSSLRLNSSIDEIREWFNNLDQLDGIEANSDSVLAYLGSVDSDKSKWKGEWTNSPAFKSAASSSNWTVVRQLHGDLSEQMFQDLPPPSSIPNTSNNRPGQSNNSGREPSVGNNTGGGNAGGSTGGNAGRAETGLTYCRGAVQYLKYINALIDSRGARTEAGSVFVVKDAAQSLWVHSGTLTGSNETNVAIRAAVAKKAYDTCVTSVDDFNRKNSFSYKKFHCKRIESIECFGSKSEAQTLPNGMRNYFTDVPQNLYFEQ